MLFAEGSNSVEVTVSDDELQGLASIFSQDCKISDNYLVVWP